MYENRTTHLSRTCLSDLWHEGALTYSVERPKDSAPAHLTTRQTKPVVHMFKLLHGVEKVETELLHSHRTYVMAEYFAWKFQEYDNTWFRWSRYSLLFHSRVSSINSFQNHPIKFSAVWYMPFHQKQQMLNVIQRLRWVRVTKPATLSSKRIFIE